ncbi:MAG: hypothetical protein K8I82_08860 [Anaerolineae bacterium]|nr:hypothetical protein [Anaerolineae bacterium]
MKFILRKYRYAVNSDEMNLTYIHKLLQARQFSDFSGRRVLTEEIGRVKQLVFGGLN